MGVRGGVVVYHANTAKDDLRGETTHMTHAAIIGIGSYLPERVLTNADLEQMVETSDEWIVSRTGIRERRIVAEGEATSGLAARAGAAALADAGIAPEKVDLLIVGTSSPDMLFPSTACLAQAKMGLTCPAYDTNAACTGFIFAVQQGAAAIESGRAKTVLVVGADALSRIVDFTDRSTCVLFGDGAGAVVLEASDEPGILSAHLHADGNQVTILNTPGHVRHGAIQGDPTLKMDGGAVFKLAVRVLEESAREALAANGLGVEDIDAYIPHQANVRIISYVGKRLGLADSRCIVTGATPAPE